jgi:hypothetical protein
MRPRVSVSQTKYARASRGFRFLSVRSFNLTLFGARRGTAIIRVLPGPNSSIDLTVMKALTMGSPHDFSAGVHESTSNDPYCLSTIVVPSARRARAMARFPAVASTVQFGLNAAGGGGDFTRALASRASNALSIARIALKMAFPLDDETPVLVLLSSSAIHLKPVGLAVCTILYSMGSQQDIKA